MTDIPRPIKKPVLKQKPFIHKKMSFSEALQDAIDRRRPILISNIVTEKDQEMKSIDQDK
jgi:hypothetical protein